MNPSTNSASGMELPPPIMEPAPAADGSAEAAPGTPEQAPAGAEKSPATSQAPATLPAVIPLPAPPSMALTTQKSGVATTTQSSGVLIADDGDLIEKEWVDKAKAIVERTRDDPYKQSEELTVVKADYMQKRYNKTIKVNK